MRPVKTIRALVHALVAVAALAGVLREAQGAAFTPGDVVVYRVGTGTGSLVNTGNAIFIDEYTLAGTLVQSVALPTATSGTTHSIIASGTATSEGLISLSADGKYLLVTGYGAAPGGSTSLSGTTGAAVPRIVGRIDSTGAVDTTTALTDFASGNNPRTATSSDGNSIWVAGGAGGVRYTTLGATTSVDLSSATFANVRQLAVFNGQLYASSGSGTNTFRGVETVGTGLPTSGAQTVTRLPGLTDTTSPSTYAFFFADLTASVAGFDTLYTVDDSTGALTKFSLVSGSWVSNGTVGTSADGYRGLTGVVNGTTVTLYAIRKGGSGATGGGELVSLADATGYNGAFSGTPTLLATAATNTAFRGIALAPASGAGGSNPSVNLSVSTNSASEAAQTAVTVTATASSAVTGSQTVTLGVSGTGITSTDYTLSSTTVTISDGQTSGSVTFTVKDDLDAEGTETVTLTISNPSAGIVLGATKTQNVTITDNDLAVCTATTTPIHSIQGSGNTAAMTGTVTVKGVVVGSFQAPTSLGGFYLQDLSPDGDPATSEGIFVFTSTPAANGQVLQITGTAKEFQGQTELDPTSIEDCQTTSSVTPVDVTLPVPADVGGVPYLERFEGMLVRFHQTLYVTEHFQLGRFGEIIMSANGRLQQPTNIAAPGAAAEAIQAANNLNQIKVDDALNNQDPDPIVFGRGGSPLSATNTLRGGDSATDMIGVLTYGWAGNAASPNAYRLRPVGALGGGVPNFQATDPRPSGPPSVGGRLKVVGMNVLNYFLTLDDGTSKCGPTGSKQACRGAQNALELARQQAKLNAVLVKLNADVIGLSELENTNDVGTGLDVNPVADIVGRLNSTLGSDVYGYINTGVIGTDTIRVGIMYKKAVVTPSGSFLVDNNPIHNRPPVAQLFTEDATGEKFTILANHFKSKSGCPTSTTDENADFGQGCFNLQRTQQAQALITFINGTVLPTVGDPDVLLVGDFNSYAKEDPITTLADAGFTNLSTRYRDAFSYSYVFSGQWGSLDHGLASATLVPQVTGASDYHNNADEPSELDYNTDFKSAGQITSLFNPDEFRASDHDPLVMGLSLFPAPKANPDNYNVEAGTTLTIAAPQGVLFNDTGKPLTILGYTNTAHGTVALNSDGSFTYTPNPGFVGMDHFDYGVSNATARYNLQVVSATAPPLGVIGGVTITGGAYGSSLTLVPGKTDEFYALTDRGPNVDGPGGTKVEPIPSFTPAIGRFKVIGTVATLQQTITLKAADGSPYSGCVNTQASTGETITDLNGNVPPPDVNGYDPEGLVALTDGTFWISDEYGPFITHFDASGKQIGRLSPFDGTLPAEIQNRIPNRGMEGLTITPDGTTLVGIVQSALQQIDIGGANAKKIAPIRIVTYKLATGEVHEYLYMLENPNANDRAVSEITALSNTQFIVDERDSLFPPGAFKKLFLIDISGATDVGANSPLIGSTEPGGVISYNAVSPFAGLLIGGKSIESRVNGQDTATATNTLSVNGITPVTKSLYVDIGGLLESADPLGRIFSHDKMEGVAVLNGGFTVVVSNDSDFGIDGLANNTPPFQLHAKVSPATGVQDDGELLFIDLVRSAATVTINVSDTTDPDTSLNSTPVDPTLSRTAVFTFSGTDSGSGVDHLECSLDSAAFATCSSGITYNNLALGPHTFAVRAVDKANRTDQTPATFGWTINGGTATFLSASCGGASFSYGGNYHCDVKVGSNTGTPQDVVTYSLDGGGAVNVPLTNGIGQFNLTTPNAGAHTVVINYPTQGNFTAAGPSTQSFTVSKALTQVTLTPSNYFPAAGTSDTLSASVTSYSAGAPSSGTVTFLDGATVIGTGPVNAQGQASLTIPAIPTGSHSYSARFEGTANFATGTSGILKIAAR